MIQPILLSLEAATGALLLNILLGTVLVYLLHSYKIKGESVIHTLCTLPLVLPPVVTGFFVLILCNPQYPLGQLLQHYHLSPVFTPYGAVIGSAIISFPLYYQTLRTAIEELDPTIQEAARVLGATPCQLFFHILLPLIKRSIATAIILTFTRALGEFGATILIAGNIPGYTQTMPLAIYFSIEQGDYTTALYYVLWIIAITFCLLYSIRIYQPKLK